MPFKNVKNGMKDVLNDLSYKIVFVEERGKYQHLHRDPTSVEAQRYASILHQP